MFDNNKIKIGSEVTFQNWSGEKRTGKVTRFIDGGSYEVQTKFATVMVDPDEIVAVEKYAEGGTIDVSQIKVGSEIVFVAGMSDAQREGVVASIISQGMYEVSSGFGKVLVDSDEIVSVKKYGYGGSIEEQNYEMVKNNNKAIAHHSKELDSVLVKNKKVPAWVVAKVYEASNDLSDITHYLDGAKYKEGGKLKIGGTDFSFLLKLSDKELVKRLDLVREQQNINGQQYFSARDKKQNTKSIEEAAKRLSLQERAIIEARLKKNKFEYGGKLSEYGGTNYLSWDFDNKGNKWNVLVAWGRNNYISVLKKTNNPFGGKMGTDYKSVDEALAKYKDPTIQANILFAIKEAEKHGKPKQWKEGGQINDLKVVKVGNLYKIKSESYTEKTGNKYYQKLSKNNKYIDLTFAMKKEAQAFASKKPTFAEGGSIWDYSDEQDEMDNGYYDFLNNDYWQKEFRKWKRSDNVIQLKDGYSTQDSQYTNRLKDETELKRYFYNEYVKGQDFYAEGGYIKGDDINPSEYVLIKATSSVGDITYVVKKSEIEKIPVFNTLEEKAKAFVDVIDDNDDKYYNVYFKELIEDSEKVKEYVSGYNHSAFYVNPMPQWKEEDLQEYESASRQYGFTISNKPKMAQGGGVQYKDLSQQKDMVINESKNKFSEKKNDVPEVEMVFKKAKEFESYPVIDSSDRAIEVFRKFWDQERIPIQESFYVMFLNTANKPISIYNPFKGGISSTVADVEIITAAAIKSLARGVIICHNHPSGQLKFSQADINLTRNLSNALKIVTITLLDSMVITENSYISMADERIDFTPTV
jgi:DNA repair protein RadC